MSWSRSVQGEKTVRVCQYVFSKNRHLLGSKLTNYLTKRVTEIENWRMCGKLENVWKIGECVEKEK